MSLPHLILGVLKYRPLSGYDLNKAFRTLIQQDLLARPLAGDDGHSGGLRDRGIPTNFAISLGLAVV